MDTSSFASVGLLPAAGRSGTDGHPPATRPDGHDPGRPGPRDRDGASGGQWRQQMDQMDPADLRTMVESLPTIEQAKGILMGYYGCSPAAAFAVLRRWSSISNVKLRDLAADLVHAATEQQPAAAGPRPPFDGVRRFIRAANLPSAGPASRR